MGKLSIKSQLVIAGFTILKVKNNVILAIRNNWYVVYINSYQLLSETEFKICTKELTEAEYIFYKYAEKKDWICEDCGCPIKRVGNSLFCENGCFEDDIRNGYTEDFLEENGVNDSEYPLDENEDLME